MIGLLVAWSTACGPARTSDDTQRPNVEPFDDSTWLQLRHSADPSHRTRLVHELPRALADASIIVRRLEREQDTSTRRALILMLGQLSPEQASSSLRQRVLPRLLQWYRNDPDAGVHSAIDWLLRYDQRGGQPRRLQWGQREVLERADRELAGDVPNGRGWMVTREGHTLAVVRGPVDFVMGSPVDERGRKPASDSPDEPQHRVRIPRSYAIGTREVTIAKFRRFLNANPAVRARHAYPDRPTRMADYLARLSPDDEGPQIAVTWHEAAMYCNWLSQQEGIPEAEWVYPPRILDAAGTLELPSDYLQRTGYRLPTEAEWEYATRAGATTSRFFGSTDAYLGEYAWFASKPQKSKEDPIDPGDPQRTWPGGQRKPNDFGLFDVYGNVWEWTQNSIALQIEPSKLRLDSEDRNLIVSDSVARPRRGGAFMYGAAHMRSANRGTVGALPATRRDNVGLRVARTLPP
jgi:formylglycine-generating enzyme required for sulfatase activity